jgi:hypothetical protein
MRYQIALTIYSCFVRENLLIGYMISVFASSKLRNA